MLAAAKLNLFLHITGKRADGYHLLQSLVMFADVGDRLRIRSSPVFDLQLCGEYAAALASEDRADNLVSRAARTLAGVANRSPDIAVELEKNLPIGAGLGGGSADAACVLRLLNEHWGLHYTTAQLADIAAPLGSDVPACVHNTSLLMESVGEQITLCNITFDVPVLLVNPRFHLSTPDVYRAYAPPFDTSIHVPKYFTSLTALFDFLEHTHNALQRPACVLAPELDTLLEQLGDLHGSRLARLSGSGATCFALFDTADDCKQAADKIQDIYPAYWVQTAMLRGN